MDGANRATVVSPTLTLVKVRLILDAVGLRVTYTIVLRLLRQAVATVTVTDVPKRVVRCGCLVEQTEHY